MQVVGNRQELVETNRSRICKISKLRDKKQSQVGINKKPTPLLVDPSLLIILFDSNRPNHEIVLKHCRYFFRKNNPKKISTKFDKNYKYVII